MPAARFITAGHSTAPPKPIHASRLSRGTSHSVAVQSSNADERSPGSRSEAHVVRKGDHTSL